MLEFFQLVRNSKKMVFQESEIEKMKICVESAWVQDDFFITDEFSFIKLVFKFKIVQISKILLGNFQLTLHSKHLQFHS